MEDGSREFNVTVVSRTCVICELTCRASNKELVAIAAGRETLRTCLNDRLGQERDHIDRQCWVCSGHQEALDLQFV